MKGLRGLVLLALTSSVAACGGDRPAAGPTPSESSVKEATAVITPTRSTTREATEKMSPRVPRRATRISPGAVEAIDPYRAPTGRPPRPTATASPIEDETEIEVLLEAIAHGSGNRAGELVAVTWYTWSSPVYTEEVTLLVDHLEAGREPIEVATIHDYSARNGRRLDLRPIASRFPDHVVLADEAHLAALRALSLGPRDVPPGPGWPITMSRPGFSSDGLQALVHVQASGGGFYLLLERVDGGWQVVDSVMNWIS